MFETVIAAMLKHKQIVFATIAVAALSGMVIAPATQVARAQLGEDIANDVLDSVFGDGGDEADEERHREGDPGAGRTGQSVPRRPHERAAGHQALPRRPDPEPGPDHASAAPSRDAAARGRAGARTHFTWRPTRA